jgi:hypothetical protein
MDWSLDNWTFMSRLVCDFSFNFLITTFRWPHVIYRVICVILWCCKPKLQIWLCCWVHVFVSRVIIFQDTLIFWSAIALCYIQLSTTLLKWHTFSNQMGNLWSCEGLITNCERLCFEPKLGTLVSWGCPLIYHIDMPKNLGKKNMPQSS